MLAKSFFRSPRPVQILFQPIFLLGILASAFLATACSSSGGQPEVSQSRPTQSQRQARFLREMQKDLQALQESVAALKYLEKEMRQLKQLEQNQNRLLLDSQERFEERMAQMEQNLEQNNLKLRKLTGEAPPLQLKSGLRPVPVLPGVPKEPTQILEEAPSSAAPRANSAEMGAEQLFESGLALHSEKQYLKAIRVFEQLRQEYPDHPNGVEGHYLIGDAYFALQDYTNAAIVFYEFTDANPQYPNAPDAQWKLAESLEKSGEIGLALDIYQEMLAQGNPYRQQAQEKLRIYEKKSQ